MDQSSSSKNSFRQAGSVLAWLRPRARLIAIFCLLHLPIALIFSDVWWIELTTHFLQQQLLLLAVCLVIWALPSSRLASLATAAMFVAVIAPVALLGWKAAQPREEPRQSDDRAVRVISFNVLTGNANHAGVSRWIGSELSSEIPNIVLLPETDDAWMKSLAPLKEKLPFQYLKPRPEGNFGLVVLSSMPIDEPAFDSLEQACEVPQFTGRIRLGGESVRFFGIHTVPPLQKWFDQRNSCLRAIEAAVVSDPSPAFVAGDLNCSPWSKWFPHQLRDVFPVLFRPHTWSGAGGIVSTSIDHVLHTEGLSAIQARVGPDLGSDHLPLIVDLQVK